MSVDRRSIQRTERNQTMTHHACSQCGHQSRCSRRSWADQHPVAAVTAALFTLTLVSMMLSEHPVAALGAIGAGAMMWAIDCERQRRAATATRADYGHRALAIAPPVLSLLAPRYQVAGEAPTRPLRTR